MAARVVPPLLLLIHKGPMEIPKAGSGEGGGPTTSLHPRITSARSPGPPSSRQGCSVQGHGPCGVGSGEYE
eukprot:3705137-Prymnesium_polylepis.1